MSKLLITAPSWIGDAVMTQPLLARLFEQRPKPVIDVLAAPWVAPIYRLMPEVNEVVTSAFKHGEFNWSARRVEGKKLRARGYDQVFVLPNSAKSALVPFFAGIPKRTGYKGEWRYGLLNDVRRLDVLSTPLMVDRYTALAEPRGKMLRRPVTNPKLVVPETQRFATLEKFGLDSAEKIAVLCPGAEYGPAKRWPEKYYAMLVEWLAERSYKVCIVGSNKDAVVGNAIAAMSNGRALQLCGKSELPEAIHIIASANVVITNDSGLMHIAAAFDRPTIALFGSSSPQFTPPLSDRAQVLQLNLQCSPCFKRECPLGHFNCMNELKPELVQRALQEQPHFKSMARVQP